MKMKLTYRGVSYQSNQVAIKPLDNPNVCKYRSCEYSSSQSVSVMQPIRYLIYRGIAYCKATGATNKRQLNYLARLHKKRAV
jgi:hypothetical protein